MFLQVCNFSNNSHCPLFTFAIFSIFKFFTYILCRLQTNNLMMQMSAMILVNLDHSQNPGKMRHSKAILRTSQDGNDQLKLNIIERSTFILEAKAVGAANKLMTVVSNVIWIGWKSYQKNLMMQMSAMRMMNICTIHRILAKWDIPKLLWVLQKETMIMINLDWEEIFTLMTNAKGAPDIDNGDMK